MFWAHFVYSLLFLDSPLPQRACHPAPVWPRGPQIMLWLWKTGEPLGLRPPQQNEFLEAGFKVILPSGSGGSCVKPWQHVATSFHTPMDHMLNLPSFKMLHSGLLSQQQEKNFSRHFVTLISPSSSSPFSFSLSIHLPSHTHTHTHTLYFVFLLFFVLGWHEKSVSNLLGPLAC